jgi:energy-coupling factor transporter ATP-binding protein EcfA2
VSEIRAHRRRRPAVDEQGTTTATEAPGGAAGPSAELPALVDRLEALARRRAAAAPVTLAARQRAERLRDHLAGHLRIRARSLDAPLLVLLLGPTGAGKSTLFNTLAGRVASPTGVLRPTTREAVLLVHPDDRAGLLEGTLAGVDPERIRVVEDDAIARGVAVLDAPDVDSVEHANRELADRLVEMADLCLFVTTASRYADRVPWQVLGRVRERGLPLIVVVNRMPPDPDDRRDVEDDVVRLLATGGLRLRSLGASEAASAGGTRATGSRELSHPDEVPLVAVTEGDVEPATESLRHQPVAPVLDRVEELRSDRDERRSVAARALAGSIAGLAPLLDAVADDAEHEAIDADALRRTAANRYESELVALREGLGRGTFLREEALRQWQSFVGADEVTRLFSSGIGRIRGAITSILRPAHAPVDPVRRATTDDLIGLARLHAAEAARKTATAWADDPATAGPVADDPSLWSVSRGFDDRLRVRIEAWIASIAEEVRTTGRPKRQLAQGASLGVNALGTGVMLATFVHTGGLTGAELGVAAGTAFLNQKLLTALFGEAAMVELIRHARENLDGLLAATFAEERGRFDALVPPGDQLRDLAADLRAASGDVRRLPPALPAEVRAVLAADPGAEVPPVTTDAALESERGLGRAVEPTT